jgi:hypothetical protein
VFRYGSSCVWAPMLRTHLALRSGAHLANSPCIAFGCPSCELALHCVLAPYLGEAILKNLPPSQNWFLSVLRLVFLHSAPFVWSFSLWLFMHFVMAVHAFCYVSSCIWVPILPTGLALHLGAPLANSPCLALRLGAHLVNSPCVAFGRPTLVRPY